MAKCWRENYEKLVTLFMDGPISEAYRIFLHIISLRNSLTFFISFDWSLFNDFMRGVMLLTKHRIIWLRFCFHSIQFKDNRLFIKWQDLHSVMQWFDKFSLIFYDFLIVAMFTQDLHSILQWFDIFFQYLLKIISNTSF